MDFWKKKPKKTPATISAPMHRRENERSRTTKAAARSSARSRTDEGMDFVFTFLPDGGYYLQTNTKRKWKNMIKQLEPRLDPSAEDPIRAFRQFSVSPQGEYAMTHVREGNKLVALGGSKGPYKLHDWVKKQPEDSRGEFLSNLYLSLGDEDSFFAYSTGKYRWRGLTDLHEETLQKRIGCSYTDGSSTRFGRSDGGWNPGNRPAQVQFGIDGNFIITFAAATEGSRHSTGYVVALKRYEKLKAALRQWKGSKEPGILYIALNPFVAEEYFILFDDGTFDWNLSPELEAELRPLVPEIAATALNKHLWWPAKRYNERRPPRTKPEYVLEPLETVRETETDLAVDEYLNAAQDGGPMGRMYYETAEVEEEVVTPPIGLPMYETTSVEQYETVEGSLDHTYSRDAPSYETMEAVGRPEHEELLPRRG